MGHKHKGAARLEPVEADWTGLLLVCSKCAGKLDGGDGLRAALKHAAKATGRGKRLRVVETRCLDVCPKDGITVYRPATATAPAVLAVARPPFDGEALLEVLLAPAG